MKGSTLWVKAYFGTCGSYKKISLHLFLCFFVSLFLCFLKLPMANSMTTPPNVALDKIAQLLNNIVDESKLAGIFDMAIHDVVL